MGINPDGVEPIYTEQQERNDEAHAKNGGAAPKVPQHRAG
jgi:hypothetical protein